MPKLLLYCEEKLLEELEIKNIDYKLNDILKNAQHFSSPGNSPTIEHPKDSQTGYFKAGSEVFIPHIYLEKDINNPLSEECVTYTFQVAWDENFSKHDTDKHWNLKIFRSIHFKNGKPKKDYYDISDFKNLNHLKCKKIKLELFDDKNILLASREFTNEQEIDTYLIESANSNLRKRKGIGKE